MKAIISGGGTGGHIFPAIAIADALRKEDPKMEILFVGANGKMEMEKVPAAGYKIEGLNIAGFHRKQLLRNIGFPFKLLSSLKNAVTIVRKFKPDVVIGVGGYASGPTLKAASWLGIPTVIQEQNSYAGVTNKLLAKKAKRIYVAYDGMDKFFDSEKISFQGNPIRREVFEHRLLNSVCREKLGIPIGPMTVFVSGGSLGARSINEAIADNYENIKAHQDVFFYWQVGKLYIEDFKKHKIASLPNVKMVDFIDDMAAAYVIGDVVICRAGALTISELAVTGNPAILIPSPNVAEDHQMHNAMALVNNGAAILVKDAEAKSTLAKVVFDLLDDERKMFSLTKEIMKLGREDAARDIARDIIKLVK